MAKSMYQKREERKNKPEEIESKQMNINWYPRTYGQNQKTDIRRYENN